MEKKLCPGQGKFKHLTFNCDPDLVHIKTNFSHDTSTYPRADPEGGTGGPETPPPWNFGKKVVIRFVIGAGLILHSIYVNYSHKSKKGSKCGDLVVRT